MEKELTEEEKFYRDVVNSKKKPGGIFKFVKQKEKEKQGLADSPAMQSRKEQIKKSKSYKAKKPMPSPGLMGPARRRKKGRITKRPMGGKVYKVDNSGQMMVQRMYGGKLGF